MAVVMPYAQMVVERGQSVRFSTIGPGVRVRAKARIFGEEYAKELFGKRWRSGELPGVVERAVGKNEWSVRCAAPAPAPHPALAVAH